MIIKGTITKVSKIENPIIFQHFQTLEAASAVCEVSASASFWPSAASWVEVTSMLCHCNPKKIKLTKEQSPKCLKLKNNQTLAFSNPRSCPGSLRSVSLSLLLAVRCFLRYPNRFIPFHITVYMYSVNLMGKHLKNLDLKLQTSKRSIAGPHSNNLKP